MTSSAASLPMTTPPSRHQLARQAQRELARRELASRHLLDWCKYVDHAYETPPHIELLADKLEAVERGEVQRLAVFMPPRHGKSELISARFPAWYLGRNPDRRVILSSYAAELANTFGRRVRNDVEEHGRHVFGVDVAADSSAAYRWDLAGHRGGMITAGVRGATTGKGADLFIIDDPIKDQKEADSDGIREDIWGWYTSVARTRLEPGAAIVLVMTRWHEDDLAGRLLDRMKAGDGEDWEVLELPAIAESEDALDREEGEALWPERYSCEDLAAIEKAVTPRVWTALFQQHPAPATGEIFGVSWWRFWRPGDLPARFSQLVLSWDCAFKDEAQAKSGKVDYVVGQVWGAAGPDFYLLDQYRDRIDFPGTIEAVELQVKKWPKAITKLVESKANGPAVVSTLRRKIPGFIEIEPDGGKLARANAVAPLVKAGNVYLPDRSHAPWVQEMLIELQKFPRYKHDDQVDALTQALNYLSDGSDWLAKMMGD